MERRRQAAFVAGSESTGLGKYLKNINLSTGDKGSKCSLKTCNPWDDFE